MRGTRGCKFRWARCPLVLELSAGVVELGFAPLSGKFRWHIVENVRNVLMSGEKIGGRLITANRYYLAFDK